MAVTDVSVLKKNRQKKKAARILLKVLVVLIIAAVAAAIVFTKDMWYPKLNGILSKVPSPSDSQAELAEGNFPIAVSSAEYTVKEMGGNLAMIDDSHFFVYNENGKNIYTEQHTLAKPVMEVSGNKALLYDLGGYKFSLSSKYKNIYSKSTDNVILTAALSSGDYAAIVTKDDKFMSTLMVYDDTGKNIFNYGSVERIIGVTFNSDSSGCYITTVGSKGGVIVCSIMYYKFGRIDYDEAGNPVPIWKIEDLETLVISVRLYGSDKIMVFGDTMCAYYDINGNILGSYDYDYDLSGYDSNGSIAAMIFNKSESRSSELVTIDSVTGEITETRLEYTADDVQVYDGLVYVKHRNGVASLTPQGELISDTDIGSDYEGFLKTGGYAFLLGYDRIDRINMK